ncbi:MAG TPA: DsbA family protein [Anaerolineae bacterium]|nr:DsbA family protein [Anaerolineae bacterium]
MIEVNKNDLIQPDLSESTVEETPIASVEEKSVEAKSDTRPNPWLLLIIGLLVGGLGGFYLYPLVVPKTETDVAPLAAVEESDQINKPDPHQAVMLAVIAGARHFQGDANAPITLVEFGDFNCGYCGKWAHETLPLIDEKYIKTGKVRMAYVHYPILGDDSMTAAEGAECAAQQDKFWDYHNTLYANQGIGFTPANLTKLANDLGLDQATFEQCLANFTDRPSLEDDIRLSQVMGVRGTPAFLVNGIPLAGAYPYEDFERIIEGILKGQF